MKTILSVDDSGVMRKIIGRSVDVLGYGFLEASNGVQALEVVDKHRSEISLIILDVNMPEMDGFEVLTRLKGSPQWASIPVMMLTTESERDKIVRAVQAGAVNYICKPFQQDDLTVKIAQSLGEDF
ncbi:MAG TPA: response regulator [Holophaga sp.]|jgi:two-component system chemotaxis response regulator CheY|nr:response regulator [Holophaga sp.]